MTYNKEVACTRCTLQSYEVIQTVIQVHVDHAATNLEERVVCTPSNLDASAEADLRYIWTKLGCAKQNESRRGSLTSRECFAFLIIFEIWSKLSSNHHSRVWELLILWKCMVRHYGWKQLMNTEISSPRRDAPIGTREHETDSATQTSFRTNKLPFQ